MGSKIKIQQSVISKKQIYNQRHTQTKSERLEKDIYQVYGCLKQAEVPILTSDKADFK
jgi:hypothetical protein